MNNKITAKSKYMFDSQPYLAFYDSEFNAYDDKKFMDIPQEVISVGLCIVDKKNVMMYMYYSLIQLKEAKRVTDRCTEITNITNSDMKNAKPFPEVIKKLGDIIKKYKIKNIYCYGNEDKKAFDRTAELYDEQMDIDIIDKKFVDIREYFKYKTKDKLGDQGLYFLKKVCNIDGEVTHNALNDAIDLSQVFHVIKNSLYDKKMCDVLLKEREDLSYYKRSKNIKDGQCIKAPIDIIKAKNKIINFL